jgi:3,2-trans-enoyl-CoA isomerase
MNTIQVTLKEKIAVIGLNRGKSNPINAEMVGELQDFIHHTENDENVAGVILTGREHFFSSGLDLIEIYDYNESQSKAFWKEFLLLQQSMVAFKKPLAAAISGHSPAGGCALAICCDYRVMAQGNYIIGLNEIPVGIIVPDSIFDLYAFWLGRKNAYQFLLEGKLLSVEEAFKFGLVDELSRGESIITAAERKIKTYLQHNPQIWRQSKLNLRQEIISKMASDQTSTLEAIQNQWWAPETRNIIKTIIHNLQKA